MVSLDRCVCVWAHEGMYRHVFSTHRALMKPAQVIEFLLLNQSCDAQLRASDEATALHYLVRFFPPDSEPKKVTKYTNVANKIIQKVEQPKIFLWLIVPLPTTRDTMTPMLIVPTSRA